MSPARAVNDVTPLSRRDALRLSGGVVGASAAAWALSACAGETIPASELTFTDGFSGARIRAIMRDSFLDELSVHTRELGAEWSRNSGATIEFLLRDDWRERYAATARAREGEDIAELFGHGPHLFSDRLVDLSTLAEEIGEAQGGWLEAARDVAMVDGLWRGIPWAFTAQAINARTDILEQIGDPTLDSYDDLLEAATRLYDADLPLAAFSMSVDAPNDSSSLAYSLLWSFGAQEVDERTGRVALDSAATRDALDYFKQLVEVSDSRALRFSEGGNNAAFLAGEIGMTQNASSIYWKAQQDGIEMMDEIQHIRFPMGPNGFHNLLEMNTLSIFEHSRSADAAQDFIRHATMPEPLRERSNLSFSFFSPPLLSRLEDPASVWNANPVFTGFKGSNESGHVAGWPAKSTIEAGLVAQNGTVARMFQSVGNGSSSVEEAVFTAANALRRVYET